MKLFETKYIPVIVDYKRFDIYEVWLLNKILLKREYVNTIRKYLQKRDWKYL